MGKKVKLGKSRKDKFYQLAKESGYRSRAAFKLLQLNRKYSLLEKSRVCIDLCAAPGGWLQVAATHMPLSSIIIGVDLAPIRSIANVITHIEDITTDKCRTTLKRDLNDRKADIVLHDGAPNVGKNWLHDAYQQNMLVLQSFKLAAEFLKKGGSFVTKVFRSKDYYSIIWVFQQFFKKVEATKPQASRNESAEIFVVCQHYKAPEKIDPKFFDIKFVFSDVDNQGEKKINDLFKNEMNQRHRGGYPDGDLTLYHKLTATDFLTKDNFVELLANSNEIVLDNEAFAKHPVTTTEIKECLKDIKILGKNEIKNLLKWRLKLKEDFKNPRKNKNPEENVNQTEDVDELLNEIKGKKKEETIEATNEEEKSEDDEEKADQDLDNELKDALHSERKQDKKKKKKLQKEKSKLKEKIALNMEQPHDQNDFNLQGDNEIFSLSKIKTKKQLIDLQQTLPGLEISDDEEYEDDMYGKRGRKKIKFDKSDDKNDFFARLENGNKDDSENEDEIEPDNERNHEKLQSDESDIDENPLLQDLIDGNRGEKRKMNTNLWFNKDAFDFLRDDGEEENSELLKYIEQEDILEETKLEKKAKAKKPKFSEFSTEPEIKSDSDSDDDGVDFPSKQKKMRTESSNKSGFEEVPQVKLNPEELALGEMMVNSKKTKNELIDESYNRYSTFDEDDKLPAWFVEDEEKNFKKLLNIPSNITGKYKKKYEDINARPIKKVVEAEARKKKRMSKKLDRARKKAETISDNVDMTDKERSREIKSVYKRAGLLAKKAIDIKYVVSKKGQRGARPGKGTQKGPYKLVDKRQKKDKSFQRKMNKKLGKPTVNGGNKSKNKAARGKGKGAGGGGGGGRNSGKNKK